MMLPKEILMRILALAILAIVTVGTAGPSRAQIYNPRYPVCMHVFEIGGDRMECSFTSIEQCQMTASGRSASCDVNPYFAGPTEREDSRRAMYPRGW
jgi:uncharacterized protein DUF3551